MNLKKITKLLKLTSFLYNAKTPEATKGKLKITDSNVELDVNGGFRRLAIAFRGSIYIYNNLPDGYSIKMTDSLIIINNLLIKKLKNNNILFDYNGSFEVLKAYIFTVSGEKIKIEIENINRLNLINNSETNLEDDSMLFLEQQRKKISTPIKKGIDDDSIKGLYAHKPLADGYTGHYNYHPKEKVYMSGRSLTGESNVVGVHSMSKKTKGNIQKVFNKKTEYIKFEPAKEMVKEIDTKPLKTKKEEIKITKGGKY